MTDISCEIEPEVTNVAATEIVERAPASGIDKSASAEVVCGDCLRYLSNVPAGTPPFDLTFLDPPFNQGKDYRRHDDRLNQSVYWSWMRDICRLVFEHSSEGAAIYFMQREKNTEFVLNALRSTGWTFQNLIIWKKKTSAIPGIARFGKAHQIIAFATKGSKPRTFNRLRIDPPLPTGYNKPRDRGVFVTDIWDDIRELTSGYFSGDESLRNQDGERVHKQQSPVALLLRIVLSSSNPNDVVLDPFLGTGTTNVVGSQLNRRSIGIEIDPLYVKVIEHRLANLRESDNVKKLLPYYRFTDQFDTLLGPGLSHREIAS